MNLVSNMLQYLKFSAMIEKFLKTYKERRELRFLAKHGCSTRKAYEKKIDPDHCNYATKIKDYYHGYPYVYCLSLHRPEIYNYDWFHNEIQFEHWFDKNCKGKYRLDAHRVTQNQQGEWQIDEMGGGDYYFVAFKEESDYLYFLLAKA